MDDQDAPPRPIPAGWLEAIERGEADLAAGRVVSVDSVLAELWESIHHMEAERAIRSSGAA